MRDSPSIPNEVMQHDQAIPTDCTQESLVLWNRTKTDYPRNATIHELFEIQVQRESNAMAVVFRDHQLTYGQLNERANQLAHHLHSLGANWGSMVAVCLERSIEMVISMLGILKAGVAYVPLDASYPPQRFSFMLKDIGSNFTCCYRITRELDQAVPLIPIGRPIVNTAVYILDAHLNPVPIGVVGELYIGGDDLGREYLNRPELTAERFIENPFSDKPGQCLYRTGDLVRYLPDGNIEFRGRADNQVKIRGFLIELGEIESVLSAHESVEEAVVLLQEDQHVDKHLLDYIVPVEKKPLSIDDLRDYMRKKLRDYMVPSYLAEFIETFQWAGRGDEFQLSSIAQEREIGEL